MSRRVVVVGGGIAGLGAAYALSRDPSGPAVTLLEASDRLGGRILSETVGGVVLDAGPDSFVTNKPWGVELARELGLEDDLLCTATADRSVYVHTRGRLRRYPDGMALMAPTRLWPFLASDFMSLPGKLRLVWEVFTPPGDPAVDESLSQFARRRFGEEAAHAVIGPMMAGIHAGDPDHLSLQSTFPMFKELERRHGSVIRALRRGLHAPARDGGRTLSLFVTLRGGLERLVRALAERLPPGTVRTGTEAAALRRTGAGWSLRLRDGAELEADAVILALPSGRAARLEGLGPELSAELAGIPYSTTAVANLVYATKDMRRPPRGFGFVVDRRSGLRLSGATFTSTKFPGRAPEGRTAIRCYLGGVGREAAASGTDSEIVAGCREELERLLGLGAEPLAAVVRRWPAATAQYNVGHQARLERVERLLQGRSGLILAGGSYRGVGIPECARSGREAARLAIAGTCGALA